VFQKSSETVVSLDPNDLQAESSEAAAAWMHPDGHPRRGRPPKMSPQEVLDRIRRLAGSREGLFRVHHRNSSLYSRARRSFGSWSAAVRAAGLDYSEALVGARRRALKARRRRSRRAGPRRADAR
jgi:hypothetical protein